MSNNETLVRLGGGPVQAEVHQSPAIRVGSAVTRVQMGHQQHSAIHVEHEASRVYGNASRHVHNPAAVDHRGSVLATRQRVNGHDTVCMQPGNEGSRTHIATALRAGLLVETSPGYYADSINT